ncbi:lipoprotein [Spiroplasma endosymbiont of Glossina fuscipes fuscipes]|uniref:lipoprotein n=1 Tax=Spiroplasma endosymbiont of Glossina fuscipes fuscipes TaxID=2004463 RepID=UPI003C74DCF3
MKKWVSILGTIGLTATSTTTLISCEKPNNNENGGGNKPKPWNPQQPPENSNWKLDNNPNFINYKVDNKWYIAIFKNYTKDWYIVNFLNDSRNDKILGEFCFYDTCQNLYLSSLREFFKRGDVKTVYQWDENNEPTILIIDKDTGKITNWKE